MGFLQESGDSLIKGVFWGMVAFAALAILGALAWVAAWLGFGLPFIG